MSRMWITELHEERSIIRSKDEPIEPMTMCEVFQKTVNRIGYRKCIVVGGSDYCSFVGLSENPFPLRCTF